MTDRDYFAAAALTGLLASRECPIDSDEAAHYCYRMADAMLRCRSGGDCPVPDNAPNHDAAPEATAPEPEPSAARRRPAGGTGDTVLGASPEARASIDSVAPQPTTHGDSDRTDKAAPRPSEGTGDTPKPISGCVSDRSKPITGPDPDSRVWETPVHTPAPHATPSVGSEPRDGTEPVAWGVANGSRVLATSISRMDAVDMQGDYAYHTEIVPLYRQPTLTDAERDAVEFFAELPWAKESGNAAEAATLRGLLERLRGTN